MISPVKRNFSKKQCVYDLVMPYRIFILVYKTLVGVFLRVGPQLDRYHALFSHLFLVLGSLTFPNPF